MRAVSGGRGGRRLASLGLVMVLATAGCAFAKRSSVDAGGGLADGASTAPAITHDASHVAFVSEATDLVAADTNGVRDVFVRDHAAGTTVRASTTDEGLQADGPSWAPAVSDDGRYVAFVSEATNLVAGDTNGTGDVFVRDLVAGTTERVSVADDGGELAWTSGTASCFGPTSDCLETGPGLAMSADGMQVAFVSRDAATSRPAILWRDRAAGTTESVIVSPTFLGSATTRYPEIAMSGDATTLAATATAAFPLVPSLTVDGLRRYERGTDTLSWVVEPDVTTSSSGCCEPALSDDGRYLAFTSAAALVPEDDDTSGCASLDPESCVLDADVLVHDAVTDAFERVSVTDAGGEIDGGAATPSISGDGSLVGWSSDDPAVLGDGVTTRQLYVRDRVGGTTRRVSTGLPDLEAPDPLATVHADADAVGTLTGDGDVVAIESAATTLVGGSDTNGVSDVMIRLREIPEPTSVVPAAVAPGSTGVVVTVTGSGFRPTMRGSNAPGVTLDDLDPVTDTEVRLTFSVAADAAPGVRQIYLFAEGPYGLLTSAPFELTIS